MPSSVLLIHGTGQLKTPELIPKGFNLERCVTVIGGEDKRMFLEFVSRMLRWKPEDRSTAKDLLSDPWLRAQFDEDDT